MLQALVYILCGLTSSLCAAALLLKYRLIRQRLLLWSGLGFVGLALNNIVLFADMELFPNVDLSIVRTIPAVLGICIILYGFIWDAI